MSRVRPGVNGPEVAGRLVRLLLSRRRMLGSGLSRASQGGFGPMSNGFHCQLCASEGRNQTRSTHEDFAASLGWAGTSASIDPYLAFLQYRRPLVCVIRTYRRQENTNWSSTSRRRMRRSGRTDRKVERSVRQTRQTINKVALNTTTTYDGAHLNMRIQVDRQRPQLTWH